MRQLPKLLFLLMTIFHGCGHELAHKDEGSRVQSKRDSIENMRIEAHRQFLTMERQEIEQFQRRMNWNMKRSGTGLHMQVFPVGTGNEKPTTGDLVSIRWRPMLLDGTQLNDSPGGDTLKWRVEQEEAIAIGMHEVVKKMRTGDSARLVLPSHLAYGVAGLQGKVPMRSALAGRIQLISVEKGN